jgi:NADH-quinone oxidoreductase subunit J
MHIPFAIIAALTLVSGVAAVTMRNLVHCALALAVAFAGLAAAYLMLDAPFAGWAQILVYVGAVAILIVFAILLTQGSEHPQQAIFGSSWAASLAVAILVFGTLAWAIQKSSISSHLPPDKPAVTIREIGNQLMTHYVLPLEIIALLLTAAAMGAVIIAMKDVPQARPGGGDSGEPASALSADGRVEAKADTH